MGCFIIEGGHRLHGEISVHGAKNAVLPILAATLINSGKNVIHNCPHLSDIDDMIQILEYLGCTVERHNNDLFVDSSDVGDMEIPEHMMKKTRSSTLFAGALGARRKKVFISSSGGCLIGKRPIDIHLDAFSKMGMNVHEAPDGVLCTGTNLMPCTLRLKFPSVGATENVMLLASLIPGKTVIQNAASEPEIVNLASFLKSIGVMITGEGTSCITVYGTDSPKNGEVKIIGDRIVGATYAVCTAVAGGDVVVNNVNPIHLSPVLALLRNMGADVRCKKDSFEISGRKRLKNMPIVSTGPHPWFPTDCQPLILALMASSSGVGIMRERIFENRFGHCHRLCMMGADIFVRGNCACVRGVKSLKGAGVDSSDLRCGAALVAASLGAEGVSRINNIHYIERGYENLCHALKSLGALIERKE